MNAELKQAKQQIRPYLRQISDTALWQLCAMAKDGRIVWESACNCIRGVVGGCSNDGYLEQSSAAAFMAEHGLLMLGVLTIDWERGSYNHYRNLRLLPMCRAEMRRRSRVAQADKEAVGV